jgi:HAUS augmin-like complex subunit 3
MENLQDSKTLKELGLNEKNQWVLFDDKPKAFFEHLAANIDSDNILSESELKQYEELCASGQFLEGDALTEELKALESHFPGILTISDEEINEMERELEFLENDTKERKERIVRMEDCQKRQLRDIEALEKKHFDMDYQGKQLEEECLEKASILSDLQKSNQKKIADLKQTYTQPVSWIMLFFNNNNKCSLFLSAKSSYAGVSDANRPAFPQM